MIQTKAEHVYVFTDQNLLLDESPIGNSCTRLCNAIVDSLQDVCSGGVTVQDGSLTSSIVVVKQTSSCMVVFQDTGTLTLSISRLLAA